MIDILEALTGLGWSVFPCVRMDKGPLTKHGFHDATTDMAQVERWLQQYPECNWGIAVPGTAIVLDIDTLDGGDPNPWPRDQDKAASLANCGAITLTPRGGRHHWFRQPIPGKWNSTAGKLAGKVDTRATNGYAVIPPSVTRIGAYAWLEGMELNCRPEELPEPPQWLVEILDAHPGRSWQRDAAKGGGSSIPAECSEVLDHGTRVWVNCSTYWHTIAMDMLAESGGAVSHTVDDVTYWIRPGKTNGVSATWNHPESRHGATHDLPNRFGYPRLTVFTPNWQPFEAMESYSTFDILHKLTPPDQWGRMDQRMHAHHDAALVNFRPELFEDNDPAPVPDEEPTEHEPEFEMEIPQGFRPGGIMDSTIKAIEASEYMRQPAFSLAAALTVMSICLNTRVTARRTMANIYCLCVCNTGEGKNASQVAVRRILEATDPPKPLDAILHGATIGMPHSDSGLLTALKHGNVRLIRADEMAAYLKAGMKNANGYTARLVTLLTELYTHGRGSYTPPVYSDEKKNQTIEATPFVTLFGSTTPQQLASAMDTESVEGGLLPRCLLFRGNDEADSANPLSDFIVPATLSSQIRAWRTWSPNSTQVGPSGTPDPRVDWKFTPQAEEILNAKTTEWLHAKRRGLRQQDLSAFIYTRQAQNVTKLALLIAADRCESPTAEWEVESGDVLFAIRLVDWMGSNMRHMVEVDLSESYTTQCANKIFRRISICGTDGVSKSQLLRRSKISSQDMQKAINHLIDSDLIECEIHGTTGRSVTVYKKR